MSRRIGSLCFGIVLGCLAAGCGLLKRAPLPPAVPPITIVAPPEARAKVPLTLTVGRDVNPNDSGRASPVVVRIYQLKKSDAFMGAQFEPLYYAEKQSLGEELVTTDQYRLAPGDAPLKVDVAFAPDTQFVGVLANFRTISDPATVWRAVVRVPRKGLNVAVDGNRLSVSATE